MSDDSARPDPPLEEQLVAYLDGELDAESSRQIEAQLATDLKLRQTLQGLDRTWELLDELDQPQIGERFTRSTLEMVTVAAEEDAQRNRAEIPRRRRRQWLIAGGSLLGAAAAGFLAVALFRPDSNQELIKDLPVLENLDEYRLIDDVAFLRMLDEAELFAEEPKDAQ